MLQYHEINLLKEADTRSIVFLFLIVLIDPERVRTIFLWALLIKPRYAGIEKTDITHYR